MKLYFSHIILIDLPNIFLISIFKEQLLNTSLIFCKFQMLITQQKAHGFMLFRFLYFFWRINNHITEVICRDKGPAIILKI